MTTAAKAFTAVRDFLIEHRDDYQAAYEGFQWPELEEFNWALDWFDPLARGNHQPALWIVEQDGSERKLSFDEMARALGSGRELAAQPGGHARGPHRPHAG